MFLILQEDVKGKKILFNYCKNYLKAKGDLATVFLKMIKKLTKIYGFNCQLQNWISQDYLQKF